MTTSNVNFNILNEAHQPSSPVMGILFFQGETKRGPINDPSIIITSPKQFREIYGNIDITSQFPLLCYRALEKGGMLRVNRVSGSGYDTAESADIGTGIATGALKEKTFIQCVADSNKSLQNKYFIIYKANDATGYYVWFNVNSEGADPLVAGKTAVPVALATNATAATVAAAIKVALNAVATTPFAASDTLGNGALIVENTATGPTTNTANGVASPGFTYTVLTQGYAGSADSPLFKILAKYPGVDYNNVKVKITDATNQNANYFNVEVTILNDSLVTEKYEDITIPGSPTVAESHYFDTLNKQSNLIAMSYLDCSAFAQPIRPANGTYSLTGGLDGTAAPILADYEGDPAAGTGFHAFDNYDDSYALACPELSEDDLPGISVAGEAYAAGRKDLRYYQHLDNTSTTAALLIAEKPSLSSKYIIFLGGGQEISHPVTSIETSISEVADVLGNMAYIHQLTKKPWNAFFGPEFGVLNNCLGPVNNFGYPAKFLDLDNLAKNRINMVVKKNGVTMLWDDFTSEVSPSPENFACINNLEIYIMKTLKPTLERFIGKPTDIKLLRDIYYTVQPFLQSLIEGRACSAIMWEGDQYASSPTDLVVNTASDMQLGKIKLNMRIITIAPLKEISVNIILTRAGVSFE